MVVAPPGAKEDMELIETSSAATDRPLMMKTVSWSETEAEPPPTAGGTRRRSNPIIKRNQVEIAETELDEDEIRTLDEEEHDDNISESAPSIRALPRSSRRFSSSSAAYRRNSSRTLLARQPSKYEERRRNKEESTQEKFEEYMAKRQIKSKSDIENTTPSSDQPTTEEAYDFFTYDIGRKEESVRLSKKKSRKKSKRQDQQDPSSNEEGDNDRQKLLAEEFFEEFGGVDWNITIPVESTFMTDKQRQDACKDLLFVPSSSKAQFEKKLDRHQQPRFYEDEGIYVGDMPPIPQRLKNKLENRLLRESEAREDGRKIWFGPDGRLVALPNPIQRKATRPIEYEENTLATETVFCPPTLPAPEGEPAYTFQPGLDNFGYVSSPGDPEHASGPPHFELEIDISSIVFDFHHLFSLEHYCASQLAQSFDEYKEIVSREAALDFERRLRVLYDASDDLREKLQVIVRKEERDFQIRRLQNYRREINLIRDKRDEESKNRREVVKKILGQWKTLRDVRRRQGFHNTSIKLLIHKETVDTREDLADWTREIRRELEESRETWEENLTNERAKYEAALEEWKKLHAKRKEARKRRKKYEKAAEEGQGSVDLEALSKDDELLNTPEPTKPNEPKDFDEASVKEAIEAKAKACRRLPGEHKIFLELVGLEGELPLESSVNDMREKNRRNATAKTKISLKIIFNGKEACHSSALSLKQDFIIPVGQIFPLRIRQWPESLSLQLLEGSHQLAEITLPLCDPSVTLSFAEMTPIEFVSGKVIKHNDHSALGSGVEFAVNYEGSETRSEKIHGKVFVRVGWGVSPEGTILAPPKEKWRPPKHQMHDPLKELLNSSTFFDSSKIEEWMTKNKIDPNDPENVELMEKLTEISKGLRNTAPGSGNDQVDGTSSQVRERVSTASLGMEGSGHFRLDDYHDQFVIGTKADVERNLRFKMLRLRNHKIGEFKNYRMIPISEKEIPKGLLESIEKKTFDFRKQAVNGGDSFRGAQREYLENLREHVNHCYAIARHRKRFKDVVSEDPPPSFGAMAIMLGGMGPVQRPLKPVRVPRKTVALKEGQEVKIMISVVRGYDVPIRREHDPLQSVSNLQSQVTLGSTSTIREGLKEAPVNTFVEVKFQKNRVRTSCAPGPNPAWNQELTLRFKSSNNDLSPDTLNRVRDSLHISLFDEVSVDLIDDESERSTHVHQRYDRKWLGSLSIPFATLYQNTQIEGTFRLRCPPILLGYERVSGNSSSAAAVGSGTESWEGSHHHHDSTYLNLYITLEPPLSFPDPINEKLDCIEEVSVIKHCERWSRDFNAKQPTRAKFSPLVSDVNGRSVLVTRYFRSIRPPPEIMDDRSGISTFERVAWFVSLIPYLPRNALFPGLQEIWPNSEEFLKMLVGSEFEHAVLLVNFFSSLGKKSYVVLGSGIPEGTTTYVLTIEENGENRLWNTITAEHFSPATNFCPLQSVWMVMDDSNVWGNIQSSDVPTRMRWDFSSTSDWFPLFGRAFPHPVVPSVQPSELSFPPPDQKAAKALREKLEPSLRRHLMSLRKKTKTSMSFNGNSVLRKLMPRLEMASGSRSNLHNLLAEHLSELYKIAASHKICGFPLHFSYVDQDEILEALTATGVHLNEEPGVEFAMAVHVEPYPCSVMSVWLYVASLVRRR